MAVKNTDIKELKEKNEQLRGLNKFKDDEFVKGFLILKESTDKINDVHASHQSSVEKLTVTTKKIESSLGKL